MFVPVSYEMVKVEHQERLERAAAERLVSAARVSRRRAAGRRNGRARRPFRLRLPKLAVPAPDAS